MPVDRSGGSASEAALRTGLKILRRGDCLGIYPEGTRSPDGRLYRGKTGVARMALEAEVPVLPVAMIDTDNGGWEVARWLRANAGRLGVSEVIHAQKIWTVQRSSEGWRSMSDQGNATANHYDHVHVSVY